MCGRCWSCWGFAGAVGVEAAVSLELRVLPLGVRAMGTVVFELSVPSGDVLEQFVRSMLELWVFGLSVLELSALQQLALQQLPCCGWPQNGGCHWRWSV